MARTEEILLNLLAVPIETKGYELVDIEINRQGSEQTIQLFIDSPHGIGMDDCVAVNQLAQEILESTDPTYETYTLEVSSPGIFRKLKTPEHFKTFTGKRIKVRLQQKVEGVKNAIGSLEECTDKEIRLRLETDGSEIVIPFTLITKANLEPILEF
ncbi:MAG: ribosome maturation factor RimP [SAR324 cluster bacterium]|jgi:ribosome maturation factor RimP|nr:ribosome maturation factor RimP [SAR324 cluster bacterium]MCH2264967.1 ribosome maturation factor RimP [SAR324 cluster bacterium]|tara:strand:- start:616 stop:1083 length:468 start_codon:yes stop_codon:yes gene_type:complete